MLLSSKSDVLGIIHTSKQKLFSIWRFLSGKKEEKFYVIFNGDECFEQELKFLLKEPMVDNPICLFRNGLLTIKGQEWIDPIQFHNREKR